MCFCKRLIEVALAAKRGRIDGLSGARGVGQRHGKRV